MTLLPVDGLRRCRHHVCLPGLILSETRRRACRAVELVGVVIVVVVDRIVLLHGSSQKPPTMRNELKSNFSMESAVVELAEQHIPSILEEK